MAARTSSLGAFQRNRLEPDAAGVRETHLGVFLGEGFLEQRLELAFSSVPCANSMPA